MLETFKSLMSFYAVLPAIFLVGLLFTYLSRGMQGRCLPDAFRALFRQHKGSESGSFSSFAALAAVIGGNLGTGNIAGIAVALTSGGPGTLFWMWVMAFLGAIIKYAGISLAIRHRVVHQGRFEGGPMFYLEKSWGRFLALLFCALTVFSALTVGNIVQVNSVALPLTQAGISPIITGLVMAILVAWVLLGDRETFAAFATRLVPLMASLYLLTCFAILCLNASQVWPAIQTIWLAAWSPSSVAGGAFGFSVAQAIRVGFDRGLFATDAGVGLAPILHAQVPNEDLSLEEHAHEQGIIGILAPIIVMSICLVTGLVLMVTGVCEEKALHSTNLCIQAFRQGLGIPFAGEIVFLTLFLFAFTTVMTWAHCALRACSFVSEKLLLPFKGLFVLLIPFGAFFKVEMAWTLADISLNMMLLVNLLGVLRLSTNSFKN